MRNPSLFQLLKQLCDKVLNSFIEGQIDLEDGEILLSDTFDSMLKMIKLLSKEEFFSILHDQLTLNQIHRFLRDNKSPLQLDL